MPSRSVVLLGLFHGDLEKPAMSTNRERFD